MANIFEKINSVFKRQLPQIKSTQFNGQGQFVGGRFARTMPTPTPSQRRISFTPPGRPTIQGAPVASAQTSGNSFFANRPSPLMPQTPVSSPTGGGSPSPQKTSTGTSSAVTQPQQGGGSTNPYDAFSLLLMNALKTAQKLDPSEILKQQRILQRESISRARGENSTTTPEELKFLSPTQQESMKNASIGALSPDLDEVAFQLTKINQERDNLVQQMEFARKSGNELKQNQLEQEWKQKDYDYKLATLAEQKRSNLAQEAAKRAEAGGTATGSNALDQISFLKDTVSKANNLAGASGASGLNKWAGDKFVGDTKFRQLEAMTNTLRTNVLTLMTDPSIKKFFAPQMSEGDVRLMTAAGTTLNPEANSPEQMRMELGRLSNLFNRMEASLPQGNSFQGSNQPQTMILNGTTLTLQGDGTYQ